MEKTIEAVIEAAKAASPAIWAAAQSKVQADIREAVILAALFVVLTGVGIGCIRAAIQAMNNHPQEDLHSILGTIGVVCTLAGVISTLHHVLCYIHLTSTPDWYAIKAIVELSPVK